MNDSSKSLSPNKRATLRKIGKFSSLATARYKERLSKAGDHRIGLSHVKETIPFELVPQFFSELSRFPFHVATLAHGGFPKSFDRFKTGLVLALTPLERELLWTSSVLKLFESRLSEFVRVQQQIMDLRRARKWSEARSALDTAEGLFGQSIWLLATKISILQEEGGLDAQKDYVYSIVRDRSAAFWAKYFAQLFSERAETQVSASKYTRNIEDLTRKIGNSHLRYYVRSHLVPVSSGSADDLAGLVGYEETSPVIDRYLTFIKACQIACASAAVTNDRVTLDCVRKALSISQLNVDDYRLQNLVHITDAHVNALQPSIEPEVLAVFDKYTTGNYECAAMEADVLIRQRPTRADLYEIYVKATARIHSQGEAESITSASAGHIQTAMNDIIARSGRYSEGLEALEKLILVSAGDPISYQLGAFLTRERSPAPNETLSSTEVLANLNCRIGNPWQYRAFRAINPATAVATKVFKGYEQSPALRLQIAIETSPSDCDAAISLLDSIPLPSDRKDFYTAVVLDRAGRAKDAIDIYERWLPNSYIPLYFEVARRLAWDYVAVEQYESAIDLIANAYLRSPQSYVSFPIVQVLNAVERRESYKFAKSIALPILYDAYAKHIDTDREGQRSDAYEDFLLNQGLQRPSDLRNAALTKAGGEWDTQNLAKLIYYLRHICTPRIMDSSVIFDGTKDLLRERISVCQLLVEIDPTNAPLYGDEIRGITQEVLVSEGVRQVEQSRIYVDTDSIKESLEKTLPESFRRYVVLLASRPHNTGTDELLKKVVEMIGKAEAEVLRLPGNERDSLFDAMFAEFRDQFVNSTVHGLAAYLSGRIRHGILPNHLRSPLELAKLATQKDSTTGRYRPNEYWIAQYPWLPPDMATGLAERLAVFTEEIDALINLVNQKWVHVQRESTPEGVFNFNVLNARRRVLQMEISLDTAYEEFLELMFRFFWDTTERNLTRLRDKIDNELKTRIIDSFDRLQQDLATLLARQHLPELDAAVAKARTDMQVMLEKVKDWFRLSKAAEKQDFNLHTLIDIAVQSTNNCFRHSPLRPAIEIRGEGRLRGKTLTSFVELLYQFLSNVILRSGKESPATSITAVLTDEDELCFTIENEVCFASERDRAIAIERVGAARAAIEDEGSRSLVAKEGGTGYAKVSKIVAHDLQCPYQVQFGFTDDDQFKVTLTIDAAKIKGQP